MQPELEGRPVFEVDFPATSRRKARVLARRPGALPLIDVRRVEIDFEQDSLEDRRDPDAALRAT